MNQGWATSRSRAGFTLVELIIVVVVIGLLVTIVLIAYSTVRKTAAIRTIQSDLVNAADTIESEGALTNGTSYPTTLPATVKASPKVSLAVVTQTLPHYSNLSTVQNGVLLSQICQDLVDQGLGKGQNAGGGTDDYQTGCGNWNSNSMQVTGWTTPPKFTTPVTDTVFTDYAAGVPAGDSYHPNQQKVVSNFYQQLHDRVVIEGGSYPVLSFWDDWANSGNGGVLKQALPTPDSTISGQYYCIQATYDNDPTFVWHIRNNGTPLTGIC